MIARIQNIKNDISKNSSKMNQKPPKNPKLKKIKILCKNASNEKTSENKLQLEMKNIKNIIFKFTKTQNLPQNHPKLETQKL